MLSGATQEGTRDLLRRLFQLLAENAQKVPAAAAPSELPVLRPRGRERLDIVEIEPGVFTVSGERAEEDALKLGEGGYEALDELQERLKRMGLEKGLRRAGARPGALVRVGAVQLEWFG